LNTTIEVRNINKKNENVSVLVHQWSATIELPAAHDISVRFTAKRHKNYPKILKKSEIKPIALDNAVPVQCGVFKSIFPKFLSILEPYFCLPLNVTSKSSHPCNRPRRPIGLLNVEDPTFSKQSAHR
jgi:hypothetical protein